MRFATRDLFIVFLLLSIITNNIVFLARRAASMDVVERYQSIPPAKVIMLPIAKHTKKIQISDLRGRLTYVVTKGHMRNSRLKNIKELN